jgi:hypothetical protein
MKHLKTFEEISPEYIQGKIAGKPDSPQKDRLQKAADDKKEMRAREENQKKSQEQEQERMKSPEYAMSKQLAQKRKQLADDFRDEKLKLYFAPMSNSKPLVIDGKGCFEISCNFLIGEYDPAQGGGLLPEMSPFSGCIVLKEGNYGSFNNYKNLEGPEVIINSHEFRVENRIEFIITKEGIQVLEWGIEAMQTLSGKISTNFEYEKSESFTEVKLVGMDLASKNKLANFIKQYASGATTGNNNLKVNGLQMPVFDKDFNYGKIKPLDLKHTEPELSDLPQHSEPVQTTANKDETESPEKLGDKVKSFLGFKK